MFALLAKVSAEKSDKNWKSCMLKFIQKSFHWPYNKTHWNCVIVDFNIILYSYSKLSYKLVDFCGWSLVFDGQNNIIIETFPLLCQIFLLPSRRKLNICGRFANFSYKASHSFWMFRRTAEFSKVWLAGIAA